jgi:hypothetical protein
MSELDEASNMGVERLEQPSKVALTSADIHYKTLANHSCFNSPWFEGAHPHLSQLNAELPFVFANVAHLHQFDLFVIEVISDSDIKPMLYVELCRWFQSWSDEGQSLGWVAHSLQKKMSTLFKIIQLQDAADIELILIRLDFNQNQIDHLVLSNELKLALPSTEKLSKLPVESMLMSADFSSGTVKPEFRQLKNGDKMRLVVPSSEVETKPYSLLSWTMDAQIDVSQVWPQVEKIDSKKS